MKLHSFAAFIALAVAPAALAAQQNTPEGPRARPGGAPVFQALLNHRQQLQLSDAQVERLRGISQRLQSRNAPLQARARDLFERAGLGELRARNAPNRGMRGGRGQRGGRGARPQLTEQQRQALQQVREQLRPLRQQMMDNRRNAVREAQEVLTPRQRQQVQRAMRRHQRRGGHHGMGPRRGRGGRRGPGRGWRDRN